MPILTGPVTKHSLNGIGDASAAMALAAFAANPSTAFLTVGTSGKIFFFILSKLFAGMASSGLVVLNVGASNLKAYIEKNEFDGSWESAEKMIEAIRSSGKELTPEQIRAIDTEVINKFRKFARIGKRK